MTVSGFGMARRITGFNRPWRMRPAETPRAGLAETDAETHAAFAKVSAPDAGSMASAELR